MFFKYDEDCVYRYVFWQFRLGNDVASVATNINLQCLFPLTSRLQIRYIHHKDYSISIASVN